MKIFSKTTLFLLVLSFAFAFCGFCLPAQTFAADGDVVEIYDAEEFVDYVNHYGGGTTLDGRATDIIVLHNNIDLSGQTLTNTNGIEAEPFAGQFVGNGHIISNMAIDLSGAETKPTNQYAGLFGYVQGATISGVGFSGTTTISTSSAVNSYVGVLAGRADQAKISNVQNTSNLSFTPNYDGNLFFGGLVGSATDTNLSYAITRSSSAVGNWNFERRDGNIFDIGGLAGRLTNCQTSLCVVEQDFGVTVGADFQGTLNFGGIVGEISQGELTNIACENAVTFTNNSQAASDASVNVGEVVGKVSTPAPASGDISYLHYSQNDGVVNRFGDLGSYTYQNSTENDFISPAQYALNSTTYFENQDWNRFLPWDFDTVWYFSVQSIRLQNFYNAYQITYTDTSSVDSVISLQTDISSLEISYGATVELDFVFQTVENGDQTLSKRQFYDLSTINLNGTPIARIVTTTVDGRVSYRASGLNDNDLVDIVADEQNEDAFSLVIKHVDRSSMGAYSISTTAKTFEGTVTSKLFKVNNDNSETLVEGEIPGYVFFVNGTQRESLPLSMTYNSSVNIRTRVKPNTPNVFVGWYLENEEGEDIFVGNNPDQPSMETINIVFGSGAFVEDDFKLYAKYQDNARVVIFAFDDGVARVDLYSGSVTLDESGTAVPISKTESAFKVEIYVKQEYEFDYEQFIVQLNTYKSEASENMFCTLEENSEKDGYNYFLFNLDMTALNVDDFGNELSIEAQTTLIQNNDMTWLWITLGCVGGVVLIGLIVLIIVLVKRRNSFGGGSSSGPKFSKKNFKNMYY